MHWLVFLMFGVGRLMNPVGSGGSAPPPSGCGATSCITTEAASDLTTEGGSNLITET